MGSIAQPLALSAVAVGAGLLLFHKLRSQAYTAEKKKANNGLTPNSPDDAGAVPIILTNKQGVEIYARRWDSATSNTNGVVVMVHGDLLWSQFFKEAALMLTSKELTVFAFDLVGYGLSGCAQGVKRHVHSFKDYLTDLDLVVDFAKSDKPGVPCFVIGEDLGGTIALAYSMDEAYKQKIAGLALSSPMLAVPQLKGSVSSFASSVFPLAPGPDWKIDYTFNDLFSDPTVIQIASKAFEEENPPTVRKITELQQLCEYVKENMDKLSTPFLLMHGEKDVRNPSELSNDLQSGAGTSLIHFRPYPDYKHGLLDDPKNTRFPIVDVQAWLSRQCSEGRAGTEAGGQQEPSAVEEATAEPV